MEKIVVGKPSDPGNAFPGDNPANWTSLTGFVTAQETSLPSWWSQGGIMVWVYRTDVAVPSNDDILTYFSNVSIAHGN